MVLRWSSQVDGGSWLADAQAPWEQVATFGPAGLPAYARLRYLPDPVRPGQAESDHGLPDDHPSELEQARAALRVLARFTETADDCWFAVWDGYPGSLDVPPDLPLLELTDAPAGWAVRAYGLVRGSLEDLDDWERFAGGFQAAPAFVWPVDHRWCFASDVDPHWAGIGAEEPAVDALVRTPGLDVVRADPRERQPRFRA